MVKGTIGYLDPDYFQTGRLTRKSDVYAFGVVLFEVLCGKRAVDRSLDEEQWGLASWAQDSIKDGRLEQIVDSSIRGRIATECLKEFAQLAERCLHSHPKKRPTMADVVVGLDYVLALQENANKTSRPAGGLKTSNGENSGRHLRSLELFFDTLGNENKVLYKFDSETINIATDYFSEANKILNHSDNMYKGRLPNQQDIAIARFYNDGMNGKSLKKASILVQLEHENLFNLLGYCIEGTEVLLAYEFAPNANLGNLLFDSKCTLLDWNKRYKIILGVARVLVYLHRHAPLQIVHCNVQPGNIFLDNSLNPKLSGFRWAKEISDTNYTEHDFFRRTYDYMAPEYINENIVSHKVDVYSFGLLVLEAISGRKTCETLIIYQAWFDWLEGTYSNTIDPRIDVDSRSMTRFFHIVLLCIQDDPVDRPTMEEVVDMLQDNSSSALPILKVPAWMVEDDNDSLGSELC